MDVTKAARTVSLLTLACLLPTALGCIGFFSQLLYWKDGDLIPAEYAGLEGKRVAVVCVSAGDNFGGGAESHLIAREVAMLLRSNVLDIQVVRPDEIADWIDVHDWDALDYREVGRGVKADRVVAIDIEGVKLYEGTALYRGRCNSQVRVFDMEDDGAEVFHKDLHDFTYPTTGPIPADMSEAKFRRFFLNMVAQQVSRYFYEYDVLNTPARDSAFIGG